MHLNIDIFYEHTMILIYWEFLREVLSVPNQLLDWQLSKATII